MRRDQIVEWLPIFLGILFLIVPLALVWNEVPALDESIKLAPNTKIVREFSTRVSHDYDILLVFNRPTHISPERFSCLLSAPESFEPNRCSGIAKELTFSWKVFDGSEMVAAGTSTQTTFATSHPTDVFEREVGYLAAKRWRKYRLELDLQAGEDLNASNPRLTISVHPDYGKGDDLFFFAGWAVGIPMLLGGIVLRWRSRRFPPPPVRHFESDMG